MQLSKRHFELLADIEKSEATWAINIRGTLLCYKYAAKQMVKQGSGGRIIGR
jgi:NAD(P)-dependent dehydrogenase (short-subunit alcohol dehydrogenase family)